MKLLTYVYFPFLIIRATVNPYFFFSVNARAKFLKVGKKDDLVVGSSHLGYKYSESKVQDQVPAKESGQINLIFGGYAHRFLDTPVEFADKKGHLVIVNQEAWDGIR